jgi:hypothetical protein
VGHILAFDARSPAVQEPLRIIRQLGFAKSLVARVVLPVDKGVASISWMTNSWLIMG